MLLETIGSLIAAKGLETFAVECVKSLVETHIKPILKTHADSQDRSCEIEECIEEYLEITYKKAMIMNTIVFRGVQKTLCDLYIPLTIVSSDESYLIDDNCLNNISTAANKILIVDTAGMGKSTIVKFLIVKHIVENKKVPILIELRRLTNETDLVYFLVKQFELLGKKILPEDLIQMIRNGEFVFFFDGYDEVSKDLKGDVLNKLQDFIIKAGNNQYVLTSRDETDLNSLGDFKRFSIKPLSMNEAFDLIKLYDQNGSLSKILINRIKKDKQLSILKEFLKNAMLTSLLYKTFQYKEEIAYKKLDFYNQVYEALFNDHDKSKGGAYVHEKESLLDGTDFERLLRRVAFFSLKNNKVEYETKAEFIQIIQASIKSMPWIEASEDKVLYDITHAIPFFQNDGIAYKWVHKSFMEFFAAGFVCYESNSTKTLLKRMVESSNFNTYKNVLDFCFEIKPEIAREVIVYPTLCNYIEFCQKIYSNKKYENYKHLDIDFLRYLNYIGKYTLFFYSNEIEAAEIFDDKRKLDKEIFNNTATKKEGKYRSKRVSRTEGNRFLVFSICYAEKDICELLFYKNVDVFSRYNMRPPVDAELEHESIITGAYNVDDNPEQWFNTEENIPILIDVIKGVGNNLKLRNYYLDYNKCIKMKNKIQKEIMIREQIEIDLD